MTSITFGKARFAPPSSDTVIIIPSAAAFGIVQKVTWFMRVVVLVPTLYAESPTVCNLVPKIAPLRIRVAGLHRPGLAPTDEANSDGVLYPRDVRGRSSL